MPTRHATQLPRRRRQRTELALVQLASYILRDPPLEAHAMPAVALFEAKNRLSELVDRVLAAESAPRAGLAGRPPAGV
jgi:hypothetical protein